MKNIETINNLSALLKAGKDLESPYLVRLSNQQNDTNFLIDRIVATAKKSIPIQVHYEKLSIEASADIKHELRVAANPVLLLLHEGEIKGIFPGMVPHFQLEQVIKELIH